MNSIYESYTSPNFLKDESFLRWRFFPTGEDCLFWERFMECHPDKRKEIDEAIRILKSLQLNNYSFETNERMLLFESLQKRISEKKRNRLKQIRYAASVAAGFALMIALSCYLFLKTNTQVDNIASVSHQADVQKKSEKDIQLILTNKEVISFAENADIKVAPDGNVVVSSDSKIIAAGNAAVSSTSLNKLIVPKGKRSSLILPDGTRVWINSGSVLEFPDCFSGNTREIRVEGEIYIEVAKNEKQPFFVHTPLFSVNIVGTRFNVSAYREDFTQSVVLVEGKVNVNFKEKTVYLLPDEKISINDREVRKEKVNIYDYISWKDGLLQFHSESLFLILNRVSRYYDVHIECDEKIKQMKCTGKLVLFDEIEEVLQTISKTLSVRYKITENQIVVYKK
ncbi:MAG: FecR domain-containing protein [Dysgonamonadaceae bacterium]|jgi:ferric-dicitrate binding protein FerR (iron transport regulator)|nr:FecR domain-containing protein [Dysgonamonadaceae bacterium]